MVHNNKQLVWQEWLKEYISKHHKNQCKYHISAAGLRMMMTLQVPWSMYPYFPYCVVLKIVLERFIPPT